MSVSRKRQFQLLPLHLRPNPNSPRREWRTFFDDGSRAMNRLPQETNPRFTASNVQVRTSWVSSASVMRFVVTVLTLPCVAQGALAGQTARDHRG
jgi:hypothetical protein